MSYILVFCLVVDEIPSIWNITFGSTHEWTHTRKEWERETVGEEKMNACCFKHFKFFKIFIVLDMCWAHWIWIWWSLCFLRLQNKVSPSSCALGPESGSNFDSMPRQCICFDCAYHLIDIQCIRKEIMLSNVLILVKWYLKVTVHCRETSNLNAIHQMFIHSFGRLEIDAARSKCYALTFYAMDHSLIFDEYCALHDLSIYQRQCSIRCACAFVDSFMLAKNILIGFFSLCLVLPPPIPLFLTFFGFKFVFVSIGRWFGIIFHK